MKIEATATSRPWRRIACYFPLLAIGLEIGWSVFLFLGLIFMVGDEPFTNTPAKGRIFDLLDSFPAVLGLICGVVVWAQRCPERAIDWICLVMGTVICALLTLGFAYGLVN